MKNIIAIIIVLFSMLSANAQSANWNSNRESNNFIYFNMGYDFGLTNQLGFAYRLNSNSSLFITSDISVPMGKTFLDDFKYRLGGQMLLLQKNQFLASAKTNLILRKHQTALVKMTSVGIDLGVVAGIYKTKWHIAGEINYDHSLSTHLRHSEAMIRNYPNITNGWYSNTGGNFSYGVQASRTLGKSLDFSMRLGKVVSKFNDTDPLLPYFGQVGILWKFGCNKK